MDEQSSHTDQQAQTEANSERQTAVQTANRQTANCSALSTAGARRRTPSPSLASRSRRDNRLPAHQAPARPRERRALGARRACAQVLFSPLVVQILMKMVGVWDQGHEPERPAAATAAASDLTGSYSLSAVGPPSAATAHGACQQQQQGGGNGPPSGTNVPAGAWQQHQQQARQGSVGGPQAEAAAAAAAFASAHQHSTRLHSFPLLQLVGGLRARVFPRVDWAALLQADEQQVSCW